MRFCSTKRDAVYTQPPKELSVRFCSTKKAKKSESGNIV